ncbi:MAG: hypothetical protein WCW56_02605 [Candidatus Paceibacterota bacterium]|jgi:hypothetical protein
MNKKKIIWLALIGFLILPLFTFAGDSSIGEKCTPENQTVKDQSCPFCVSGPGKNGVNLRWNILGIPSSATISCSLECEDGSESCGSFVGKDREGYAVNTNPSSKFGKQGEVKILSPDQGDVYQVICNGIKSQRMTITGCAGSCERPFNQIVADINAGKVTKITEASFYGWANDDKQDNFTASGGRGSGDKQDVKNAMAGLQGVCQLQGNSFNNSLEVINYMISNPNFPIPLSLTLLIGGEQSGHRVIALSAAKVGNVYEVEVIDPTKNGSRKYKLTNCGPENPGEKSFYCDSPIDGKKAVFISSATNYDSFINGIKSYCRNSSNSNSKICQGRSGNLSTWLSNNFPQLGNFIDIGNPRGNCAGWTDFILRVAYFGDFVGTDYHPSDRIGVRCNADLTSKQGAFKGLSSQMANLKQLVWPSDWASWKNLFVR